ncbi:hypothetical protein GGQ60_000272 [Pedobacter zeae]|uniref:Uncharacterized protein n=1 Tax=Pedobacter zeae TaxID=1737356 RepID=A0A7W6P3V3_9SPHI|nr:hypothetical protein [Pedobacter zeae]
MTLGKDACSIYGKTSQKNHKLLLIKPDCREKPGVQRGLEAKSRTELT